MAQKKSAFIIFVNSYKNEESKKGKPSMSFNELVKKLSPVWNVSYMYINLYIKLADSHSFTQVTQ